MLDTDHAVTVILDTAVFKHNGLALHPLKNDATTLISPYDLKKFVEVCGNRMVEIDFYE